MIIRLYRWFNDDESTVDCGQWYEWEVLTDNKVLEVKEYIKRGYDYQIIEIDVPDETGVFYGTCHRVYG